MKTKLAGLIAAPFTPMHPDGSIKPEMIRKLAAHLRQNKVAGAFICGTTGEGPSLSTDERLKLAEQWVQACSDQLRVIVHVGHQSVMESRALGAHAERIEAHGFAMSAPSFFRVTRITQLVDLCARVAEAAATLPFYYYHFPAMTGADLPMIDFLEVASRQIPNLAGIKFTHENLMDYRRCLDFESGRFNILFGRDEMLLAALAMGATAVVGSTYNYLAPLYHRIIEAFQGEELEAAQRLQSQANEVIAIMVKHGGLGAGKAMMKMIGLDCGPVRLPLENPSPEMIASLARELQASGFPLAEVTKEKKEKRTRIATP